MKKIIISVLVLALLNSCSGEEKKKEVKKTTVAPSALNVKEIIAVGKVEPQDEIINLAASASGIVKEIYTKDGADVKKGQLLVKIDDDLDQIKIKQIIGQKITQESEIRIEESAISESNIKLENKRNLLRTSQNLVSKGAEQRQVLVDLETEIKTLENDILRHQNAILRIKNRLKEYDDQLDFAKMEASKKSILSPYNGKVLDIKINKGAALTAYQNFIEIAPEGQLIVRAEVDELFCDQLMTGQKVEVRYVGTEKTIANGEIVDVAPYLKRKSIFSEKASDQEDRRVREIKISLKDNSSLIINSKVECLIKI